MRPPIETGGRSAQFEQFAQILPQFSRTTDLKRRLGRVRRRFVTSDFLGETVDILTINQPASETGVSAILEMPGQGAVRDLHSLTGLIACILRDLGQPVRSSAQTDTDDARIETRDYALTIRRDGVRLALHLCGTSEVAPQGQSLEIMLVSLLRVCCSVLRPTAIRWRNMEEPLDPITFLAASGSVVPRRRERPATASAPSADPAPRPELPRVQTPEEAALMARFNAYRGTVTQEDLSSAPPPRAPIWQTALAWALTAATALVSLPVASAMAVLNLFRGASLRLNTLVLVLTVALMGPFEAPFVQNRLITLYPAFESVAARVTGLRATLPLAGFAAPSAETVVDAGSGDT